MASDRKIFERAMLVFVFASFVLTALAFAWKYFYWDFDDSFIVYRYVENIISGNGWRYNLSESYNASTSVLNPLLIALPSFFAGDPRLVAHVLGGIWLLLSGVSLFLLMRRQYGDIYAAASAVFIVFILGRNATWGIETNLFLSLCILFALMESYGYNTWYLLGLIVLARPDGLVLLMAKTAVSSYMQRRLPWKGILQSLLVLLPWVLYSLFTFHQVFPETLKQKMMQARSGFWGEGNIYLGFLAGLARTWKTWLMATAVPAALGAVFMVRRRSPLLYLLFFALSVQAAYVVLNVPGYHWYACSLTTVYNICVLYGLGEALLLAGKPLGRLLDERMPGNVPAIAGAAAAAGLLVFSVYTLKDMTGMPETDGRTEAYRLLSQDINEKVGPGTLAALEVGAVGYYTRREILDLTGLTSSRGEFMTGRKNDIFFSLLPRVVLVHSSVSNKERKIIEDPRILEYYNLGGTVSSPAYQDMVYFVRKDGV
ncbi:MAG TPA: hypothetical protein VJM83_03090 [Nitrospirota bacterium]|nr:hypothetical protein [Nitrospirota bacterium]